MHEKRQEIFWTCFKNTCFLVEFSLAEFGGTPPLTENHPAQKPLAERGVPPLTEKIC